MKEPIMPRHPDEWEYKARVERRYIYKHSDRLRDDDTYEDDDDDEDEPGEDASLPAKDISEVNLAWLIKQIPKGLDTKDIKIDFGFNANCMAYEDHYVNFYYEEKIPARTAELKAVMSKYKEAFKKYEEDLVTYKAFCKARNIKEAEEKLAQLKGEQV